MIERVPVAAIVQPADLSIQRLVHLDAKVDAAEGDGILARWQFGRELLREVVGKQLPAGRLEKVAESIGKAQSEVSQRLRLARQYETEDELRYAVAKFRSWHGFVTNTVANLGSSDSNEWYTPAEYVEAARRVLGAIDLDPASCAEANTVVGASRYFDAEDDGLALEWHGRVFTNPPYGKLCPLFIDKLRAEYEAGNVTAAVALVNGYSVETRWFQPLYNYPICFPDHRLRGWPNPTFGSAFVYLGPDDARFIAEFRPYGPIVRAVA